MTRPTGPGWWWGAYGECLASPTHVEVIGGHLVADDGATERRVDDPEWTWVAPVAPPVTPLDELVALCQRLELRMAMEWNPKSAELYGTDAAWAVEVGPVTIFGRLDDAIARHLERLRGAA